MLACVLLLFTAGLAQAQDEGGHRSFMIQFGVGWAFVSYGNDMDSALSYGTSIGLDRIDFGLNLALGGAVTQDLYFIALADWLATRLSDSYGNYMQLNTIMYGIGLRAYPFHTGLVLGLDGGIATLGLETNVGVGATSPNGWGGAVSLAYDFNRRATGLSLILGAKYHYFSIDQGQISALTLFVDLAWK